MLLNKRETSNNRLYLLNACLKCSNKVHPDFII